MSETEIVMLGVLCLSVGLAFGVTAIDLIGQRRALRRVRREIDDASGCFDAAETEGLMQALVDLSVTGSSEGARVVDLVQRRLLYAPHHLKIALDELNEVLSEGDESGNSWR